MSDYSDILSRKTFRDRFSEGLNKQADSIGKPMNKGQAATQNILRGFAAGFGNDREREAKLAELEEQYKQVDMLDRQLKMSTGKNQLIKAQNENFFLTYQNDYGVLDKLLEQGKTKEADFVLRDLFGKFNELNPDRKLGTYLGFDDTTGNIFVHDNNGNAKSMHYSDLTAQTIPQDRHADYPNLLTRNSKFIINNKMKMLALDEEKSRVSIDQAKAQIANLNAHGKLYEVQAKEALRKAEVGTLTDKEKLTLKTNITKNRDYVEKEILPKLEANEKVLTLYDKLGNIVKENPNLVGSDYVAKVRRTIGEVLGLDPALDYAKMTSIDFEKTLRPILGAQFTEKEGNRILGKYPSIEKNITALKQFLKEERPALIKNIVKQKAMYTAYNKDNSANILDENLLGDLNSEYKNYIYDKYGSEISLEIDNKDINYKKLNSIKEKIGK